MPADPRKNPPITVKDENQQQGILFPREGADGAGWRIFTEARSPVLKGWFPNIETWLPGKASGRRRRGHLPGGPHGEVSWSGFCGFPRGGDSRSYPLSGGCSLGGECRPRQGRKSVLIVCAMPFGAACPSIRGVPFAVRASDNAELGMCPPCPT